MWPQKWVCPRHGVITPLPLMATYAMLLVIFSCGKPGSQRPLYQLKPAIKLLKRKWQTNRVLQCELRHVSEVSQHSKCRKHPIKYIKGYHILRIYLRQYYWIGILFCLLNKCLSKECLIRFKMWKWRCFLQGLHCNRRSIPVIVKHRSHVWCELMMLPLRFETIINLEILKDHK